MDLQAGSGLLTSFATHRDILQDNKLPPWGRCCFLGSQSNRIPGFKLVSVSHSRAGRAANLWKSHLLRHSWILLLLQSSTTIIYLLHPHYHSHPWLNARNKLASATSPRHFPSYPSLFIDSTTTPTVFERYLSLITASDFALLILTLINPQTTKF